MNLNKKKSLYESIMKNIATQLKKSLNEVELDTARSAYTKAKKSYDNTDNRYEKRVRKRQIKTFGNYIAANSSNDISHIDTSGSDSPNGVLDEFLEWLQKDYKRIDLSKVERVTVREYHWEIDFAIKYDGKWFECEFTMEGDYSGWDINLDPKFDHYTSSHYDDLSASVEDYDYDMEVPESSYIISEILNALADYIEQH